MPILALFRRNPPANGYGPLSINSTTSDTELDDSLLNGSVTDGSFPNHETNGFTPGGAASQGRACCSGKCGCSKSMNCSLRNIVDFLLTNAVFSVIFLVIGVVLPASLGLWALCVLKPHMVIDKSMNSFTIPNHQATKRADALSVAISHMNTGSNFWRGKRSVDDVQAEQFLWKNHGSSQKNQNNWHDSESKPSVKNMHKSSFKENIPFNNAGPEKVNLRTNSSLPKTSNKRNAEKPTSASKRKVILPKKYDRFRGPDHAKVSNLNLFSPQTDQLHPDQDGQEEFSVHRQKRSAQPRNKRHGLDIVYTSPQRVLRWRLQLAYVAVGEDEPNIFTEERLATIHGVEKKIMEHSDFQKFCWKDDSKIRQDPTLLQYNGCAPLNSLLTYFYPSKDEKGKIHYDGLGDQVINIDSAVRKAMTHQSFYYFVGDMFNRTLRKGSLLHTEVFFGVPLEGYSNSMDRYDEQYAKYKEFIISYVDILSKSSTDKVIVLYGGNEIFDYEVEHSFWSDMRLAIFSLSFIVIIMFILTSFSKWLTLCGITSIGLSFLLALFFYRAVFKMNSLGILNGASAFVIIGIGVDDIFVFINTFRQSCHMKDLASRLRHTIYTAGKATFFTSFTTAAAFAANVASSIPAIHDFGLFMSLVVGSCWLNVIVIMPPALNIWSRLCVKCEEMCYSCCGQCKGSVSSLHLPDDIREFVDSTGQPSMVEHSPENEEEDEDDVPLMRIEENTTNALWGDDSDDQLLRLEAELESSETKSEGCSLTARIQVFVYYFIALPVIKMRWLILVCYVMLLIVAACLVGQLKTATKPPQFFRPESNLQRFYDLKSNLSIDVLNCERCSAIYEVSRAEARHHHPATPPKRATTPKPRVVPTTPPVIHPTITNSSAKSKTDVQPTTEAGRQPRTPTTQLPTTVKNNGHRLHTLPASHPELKTTPTPKPTVKPTAGSASKDFDACGNHGEKCGTPAPQPVLESSAAIYVVIGIKGIDRSKVSNNHVLTEKGEVVYDKAFAKAFNFTHGIDVDGVALRDLCKICKLIANNTELVKPNSAQCLPSEMPKYLQLKLLNRYEECRNLPKNKIVYNHHLPVRALMSFNGKSPGIRWISFAFESTTSKSESYFTAYKQYQKWEAYLEHLKKTVLPPDSPLLSMYQTSRFWQDVFKEIVAVSSAIYGLVLSMVICMAAVAIFTGHILLLVIIVLSILGMILCVVGIFYVAGWEMGAVEAISLSILVGSSVDYCVHLVVPGQGELYI